MFIIKTLLLLCVFKYTEPEKSSSQPEDSSYQPEESSYQPEESSYQPEESSYQPEESSYQPEENSCTTPDNTTGQCVSAENWPTVVNFLINSPKPFPPEISELLQKYVCSNEKEAVNTKDRCPLDSVILSTFDEDIEYPPPPPNVVRHPNRKLLHDECGYIDIDKIISYGNNAEIVEFPWMALLAYQSDSGIIYECGGSIINERHILTAAHCVVNNVYPLKYVRIGEYNLLTEEDCDRNDPERCLPPAQDLPIEKVIIHPEYNTTSFANDIALLRVPKIDFGEDSAILPVCLPVYDDAANEDFTSGVVTGWGVPVLNGTNAKNILQKVELKKRNLYLCVESYKADPKIRLSYKQLCVSGIGNKDSCGGDSGGPFQVPVHLYGDDKYIQHGIVSIGHRECGTAGLPAVYTKVLYYTKWILDNLKT